MNEPSTVKECFFLFRDKKSEYHTLKCKDPDNPRIQILSDELEELVEKAGSLLGT